MGTKSEIVSGLTTLTISASIPNPAIAAIVSCTLQPVLTATIEEFGKRLLTSRQNNRIERVLKDAVDKISCRLEKKEMPCQNESFWMDQPVGISDAKAILEGLLLKARDEYEEKKLIYYSNLIAQMVFDPSWSYQRLNAMIRMFEQLSYRQLQLMALALKKEVIETPQWDVKFKGTPESYAYYDLYCEVVNLSNFALFHQPEATLTMGLGNRLALSPIGQSMAELMELSSIPQEELDELDNIINLLNDNILKM